MQDISVKLRFIYLPFLLMAFACIAGYSLLNWLVLIKGGFLPPDEDLVDFWLPYAVPWVPVLIWLRPRVKALRLKGENLPSLYYFIAASAIAVPTMIGQKYLAAAAGEITHLNRISQIDEAPATKYYTVQHAYFDKDYTSVATSMKYSGRIGQYLYMRVFLACPLSDSENAPASGGACWLGTVYKYQVGSGLSDSQRDEQFHSFVRNSMESYEKLNLESFTYLERAGVNDEGRGLDAAARRSSRYQPGGSVTILEARQGSFEERSGNNLAWVFGSLGIGAFVWLLMVVIAPVDHPELARLLRGEVAKTKPLFPAYKLLVPNRQLFVTPILLDLNILVFLGMALAGMGFMSFDTRDLLALGGLSRPTVMDGQVWRLVTSMFIHGGFAHLAGNLFMLLIAGFLLEPVFGRARFAVCYLLSGIAGGVATVYWHGTGVAVGASGAIFGIMGAVIGFSFFNKSKPSFEKRHVVGFVLYIVGYNLLLGILPGPTDNAGHLGGLACGVLFGAFFNVFPGFMPRRQAPPGTAHDRPLI